MFLRDLAAGTTRLVRAVDGTADTASNQPAFTPALDAGGGCVVFASRADNLTVPGYPTQDFAQVYLRAVKGECPVVATTPTTTTTTLPPPGSGAPIAAKTVVLRPGRLAKLVAEGGGCQVALLRRKLAAVCRGDTGDLRLPEPGPLEVLLVVGGEAYCAECGGRTAGRPARVFRRRACPAPATCP